MNIVERHKCIKEGDDLSLDHFVLNNFYWATQEGASNYWVVWVGKYKKSTVRYIEVKLFEDHFEKADEND